ncbi:transcription initiation factor TFIID subunit 5-like, partial [Trifolium medium]|nr:transcription initiation factor TFIID subunit 5-like [Trifolium medium]
VILFIDLVSQNSKNFKFFASVFLCYCMMSYVTYLSPTEVEQSILEDLRNRVQLSSVALPSVSFYTFINTHNGLSCSSISHDGSLVAGGFSDSSLKVWDMAKLGQQPSSSLSQDENDTSQNEQMLGKSGGKRQYTLFQGHSGPVYATSFCPVGDFILSSSADSTILILNFKWSMQFVYGAQSLMPILFVTRATIILSGMFR